MTLERNAIRLFQGGPLLDSRHIRLTRPLDSLAGLPHHSYEGVVCTSMLIDPGPPRC